MQLCLLISSLRGGGAERVMTDMANYWVNHGWSVTLITWSADDINDFYVCDAKVHRIQLRLKMPANGLGKKILYNLKRILAIRKILLCHQKNTTSSWI